MKNFIFKILVFVLPIILSGYYIDRFISNNLRKSNSHAQKEYQTWNAIIDGKLNADVLIYGSSRAWVHFDPKIIKDSLNHSVYNLGMDGHTFNLQYLRHLLALKNNPKPKLIIHSVDIGTLSKGNLYNPDQFLPYMLWNKTFYDNMSKYDGYSSFDYKIPLIRYYGKLDAIKTAIKMIAFSKNNKVERVRGYQGQNTSWNNDFDEAKKNMKKYVAVPDILTLNLFDNYLKECKEHNIEVILVYSPYYIEGQKFIENQKQIINIYKNLALKYEFSFIDFTNDEICFDKKYFYNASHMNITGAELFSRKLCGQIKSTNAQQAFGKKAGSVVH
jgi:adenylate kinase family enzyme